MGTLITDEAKREIEMIRRRLALAAREGAEELGRLALAAEGGAHVSETPVQHSITRINTLCGRLTAYEDILRGAK